MKKILLLFSVLIVACNTGKQLQKDNVITTSNEIVDINVVNNGKQIEFLIKNLNETPIYLVNTSNLNIERKNNNEWERLRILPCPCDAPCHQNKENIEITTGKEYKILWDMEESWCGTERVNRVRNTVRQTVEKGIYRIRITYKTKDNKPEIIYKEFVIQ